MNLLKLASASILSGLILSLITSVAIASDNTKVNLLGTNPLTVVTLKPLSPDRVVILDRPVSVDSIAPIIIDITNMLVSPRKPAYLILDSPGGDVMAGFQLIKLIQGAKAQLGFKLTCIIEGRAASMAAIIASYCDKTYIASTGMLMYHQPSFGIQGPADIMKTRIEFTLRWISQLEHNLAKQLGIPYDKYKDLTAHELWLTSEESVQGGYVDGLVENFYYIRPTTNTNNIFQRLFQYFTPDEGMYVKIDRP